MTFTIGIDVGGSATKIAAFNAEGTLVTPLFVRATDPLTSIYGALGRFTAENKIELSSIDRIMVTGAGGSCVGNELYGRPCVHESEFDSVGRGGLYLSGLKKAIVVSMGTGTALVYSTAGGSNTYLGGTGVGGGSLMGLSKLLLGMENLEHVAEFAKEGDLSHIDLRVSEITSSGDKLGLRQDLTAANFGKVSDLASKGDLSLGLFNMVFETIGMLSIFAARSRKVSDVVLTGRLSALEQAKKTFDGLTDIFGVNFIIPPLSEFGTVIGAALGAVKKPLPAPSVQKKT